MKTCVILPAYNESRTIGELVARIAGAVPDIVVVDDGSDDGTGGEAKNSGAVVLRNERNLGKGASLRRGFEYAAEQGFEAVITMDADGQHDWEEIPCFIREMEKTGADMVLGTRMGSTAGMPLVRLLTNVVTSAVVSALCFRKITDSQTGYRMIKTGVLRSVRLETSNYDTESEILIKASRMGFVIKEIPVRTIYSGSESKIRPGRDTLRFVKLALKSMFCHGSRKNIR